MNLLRLIRESAVTDIPIPDDRSEIPVDENIPPDVGDTAHQVQLDYEVGLDA